MPAFVPSKVVFVFFCCDTWYVSSYSKSSNTCCKCGVETEAVVHLVSESLGKFQLTSALQFFREDVSMHLDSL